MAIDKYGLFRSKPDTSPSLLDMSVDLKSAWGEQVVTAIAITLALTFITAIATLMCVA
jgi:hypothetical protein